MSISPPSDIVLDVARAADPTELAAARAELQKRALAAGATAPFPDLSPHGASSPAMRTSALQKPSEAQTKEKTYRKFEAVVLQTFLKEMMPKDTQSVYGQGLAGDMWKSELSQQVADVMAKHGGIGIADMLLKHQYGASGKAAAAGDPSGHAASKAAGPDAGTKHRLSKALIEELQRRLTDPVVQGPTSIINTRRS